MLEFLKDEISVLLSIITEIKEYEPYNNYLLLASPLAPSGTKRTNNVLVRNEFQLK